MNRAQKDPVDVLLNALEEALAAHRRRMASLERRVEQVEGERRERA